MPMNMKYKFPKFGFMSKKRKKKKISLNIK